MSEQSAVYIVPKGHHEILMDEVGAFTIGETEIKIDPFSDMAEEPEEEADQLLQDYPFPVDKYEQGFHICDRDTADWLLKKMAAIASERDLIKAQCKLRLAQLEADETRLNNRFRAELEAFVKEEVAKGKRKSLTLLHGTVAVRKVSDTYKIEDEAEAINFCAQIGNEREYGGLLESNPVLNKRKYSLQAEGWFELTGELLPGVARTEAHEAVSIKFPKAGQSAESESEV